MPHLACLLAVVMLAAAVPRAALGQLQPPQFQITDTAGSFSYKWTLDKTVMGTSSTASVRVQKGTVSQLQYKLTYTKTIDDASKSFTVSGSFTVQNAANAVTINTVAVQVVGTSNTDVQPQCNPGPGGQVPPNGQMTCTFTNANYVGYPQAGKVTATITFTDATAGGAPGSVTGESTPFTYDSVVGKQNTAVLADKFDLSPLDQLYTGFTGFVRSSVWSYADPSTAVPESGVTVQDGGEKAYTINAGKFAVCSGLNGVAITNTATLTPNGGTAITKTATASLVIFGCELPPTVNFQELASWGAQTFSWQLTKRALRNAITVDQTVGSVGIDYNLQATATPTTGSWAVSGSVFVANTQPGMLNIARIMVQTSTGQQAFPQCALTTPWVSPDGLVWGGTNAGGSITNVGAMTALGVNAATSSALGVAAPLGTFSQFILPEFASATCRFNMTIQSQPSPTMTIVPMVNWGFGGMYTLNQPNQETLRFNPPDNFFPVQGCIVLTDVATAGPLQGALSNGGPNQQSVCVTGTSQPFQQPAPLSYTMTATINPTTTPDCTPGGQKTYSVANAVTGVIQGGASANAKADPVQITVNCAKAATTAMQTQSTAQVASLSVSVGGYQTYVSQASGWTAALTADADTLSLPVGGLPKTVTWTLRVAKGPSSKNKFFVFGKITTTNPGTKPVDVVAVSVTAGSAAVPATCPPGPKTVSPGAPYVCTFNVTWNNGANSGTLGARVDTTDSSFYGPPAAFDFTNPVVGGAKGSTADVYNDVVGMAPKSATGVPTKWFTLDGSAPPATADGIPLTTADSRDYTYTMQVGPFADKGSCGSYTITNTATVTPSDGGAPVTATKSLAVTVTGCGGAEYQSVNTGPALSVVVGGVAATNVSGATWKVSATPKPATLALDAGKAGTASFSVAFTKVTKMSHEVTGTVTVANPDPQNPVNVASVTVSVEADTAKTVDAACDGGGNAFKLAGGATKACRFTATVESNGGGEIIATVTDDKDKTAESAPAPLDFSKAKASDAGGQACAQATTGLVVGVTNWKAGGAAGFTPAQQKVCDTTTVDVPVSIAAPSSAQCPGFSVGTVALLSPLAAGTAPLSTYASLPVTVNGCPKGGGGGGPSVTAADPDVEVQELYAWTAKLTSNATNPLIVKQGAPVRVQFVADTQRAPVRRSAAVKGTVTLEAPGPAPLTVKSAAVAVYDGTASYVLAPLDCGAAGKPGGPVALKGKGSTVTCSYKAAGLGTSDGAVLPVIVADGAAGPAGASPAAYVASSAPKNIVGDCADIGTSMQLSGPGAARRAPWQPAFAGQPLGGGSDCEGGNLNRFTLVFGTTAAGAPVNPPCGGYKFSGTLAVAPTNGDAVTDDESFAVSVPCRRRSALERTFLGLQPLPGSTD